MRTAKWFENATLLAMIYSAATGSDGAAGCGWSLACKKTSSLDSVEPPLASLRGVPSFFAVSLSSGAPSLVAAAAEAAASLAGVGAGGGGGFI